MPQTAWPIIKEVATNLNPLGEFNLNTQGSGVLCSANYSNMPCMCDISCYCDDDYCDCDTDCGCEAEINNASLTLAAPSRLIAALYPATKYSPEHTYAILVSWLKNDLQAAETWQTSKFEIIYDYYSEELGRVQLDPKVAEQFDSAARLALIMPPARAVTRIVLAEERPALLDQLALKAYRPGFIDPNELILPAIDQVDQEKLKRYRDLFAINLRVDLTFVQQQLAQFSDPPQAIVWRTEQGNLVLDGAIRALAAKQEGINELPVLFAI